MIVIIAILVITLILYTKYYNINEAFSANKFAYLNLDPEKYKSLPDDHYYYNNPPYTQNRGLTLLRKSSGKYCNNNKSKPYRQDSNYEVLCSGGANNVNQLFNVDSEGLIQTMVNRAKQNIENINNNTIKSVGTELDNLIDKYVELKDEITYAKKFLEENQYSSKRFREYNKKLDNTIDKNIQNNNSQSQKILVLKEAYDSKRLFKDKLHKYAKYIIIGVAFITVIYLFSKQYIKSIKKETSNIVNNNNNKAMSNQNRAFLNNKIGNNSFSVGAKTGN